MAITVSHALLEDIKLHLGITWDSPGTDSRVTEAISSGMAYITEKLKSPVDFSSAGEARSLLFEYARYHYNGAVDVFENNFHSRIIALINARKVMQYAQSALSCDE